MSTFILIHGAWHGAWCWEKITPLLIQKGHSVRCPDLPGHGKDKTLPSKISVQNYVNTVSEILIKETEPVILVGHSLGGITITQVAEAWPDKIKSLVFLTGFLLPNGVARLGYGANIKGSLIEQNKVMSDDNTYVSFQPAGVQATFYHDCSEEDVNRAKSLICPEPLAGIIEPVNYTANNFGRVTKIYIECLQDHAIPIELQRQMYNDASVKHIITMNTGHSPFYAAPEELAKILMGL